MNWQEKFEKKFITMDGVDGYDFNLNVEAGEVREFIGDLLKERDDEIKRLTLMFQTTTFDLSSAERKLKEQAHDNEILVNSILETKNAELKEEYQRGYNKGVLDHSARLEDVINEASEKARQEGYEVGFAQAESGLPDPMIEFIRKDERMKRDEEIAMLLENIVMNHVEETNNSLHVRMLKNLINNLKN